MTGGALVGNVLAFAHVLRRAGLDVHTGRVIDAVAALEWVTIAQRDDVRAALKTLFVHRREDLSRFDEAFDVFWRDRAGPALGLPLFSLGERPRVVTAQAPSASLTADQPGIGVENPTAAPRLAVGAYSPAEVSRTKDFKDFTADELMAAEAVLSKLGWDLGLRRTRRWSVGTAGAVDLRRIVRRNMKHGGELIDLPRRELVEKARPIVVLADVSGSMEPYSRMLLHFVSGLTQGATGVESFLFATRLTRVTHLLSRRGAARVLGKVAQSVPDWGSGTRIGEALRAFNVHWARRVMRNGPVVLLLSDGWDRGDPQLLARELSRVHRCCRRLIWLNPLLGSSNYEPLTRGMVAARRHIDDFRPVHNLLSLEQLAEHLRDRSGSRLRVRAAWS